MPGQLTYSDGEGYLRAQINGNPSLGEFVELLQQLSAESLARSCNRVLLDLQAVGKVYSFTEQFALGQAGARILAHLHKVASVVPADRVTRVSEKAANQSGANVRVFASEAEAVNWLLAPAQGLR